MNVINVKTEINDLLGYGELKIVQCKDYFNFSLESVLLPNFITITPSDKNIIDLGCGNAPMPLILNYLYPFLNITGVELQSEIYSLAMETLKINNLENKINIVKMDIKDIKSKYKDKAETFDVVISNPPYFTKNQTKNINKEMIKSIARHEIKINIDEIIETASFLLKNKGKIGIVHRTERLVDVITTLKKYNIEPKRIKFIYSKSGSNSKLFMIEGVKNTGMGIKVLKPLIVHEKDGKYTKEVKEIFKM